MNLKLLLLLPSFVVSGNTILFSQATDKKQPQNKSVEKLAVPIVEFSDEVKNQAADMLQQNLSLSLTLNSDENRISYVLKTANLLWKIDKTQSRTMFRTAFEDIRKIVYQTDFEIDELDKMLETDISKPLRQKEVFAKLKKLGSLSIAVSTLLATTEPRLAYTFFEELKNEIKNEQLKRNFDKSVSLLQAPLLDEIAENDLDKAITVANKRLKAQGFFDDSIDFLLTIQKKEPKKASDFAKSILISLKTSRNAKQYLSSMNRLLEIVKNSLISNDSTQKPLLNRSDFTDLADIIDSFTYNPSTNSDVPSKSDLSIKTQRDAAAREKLLNDINSALKAKSGAKALFQTEINGLLRPISNKNLPSVDKKRIIDDTLRKIVLLIDKQFQFEMLIFSSQKVFESGEKDSTIRILNEAELLIKTFPRTLVDFSNNWLLAEAFFGVDENKSFTIVENIYTQLNQVINAYAIYNEFLSGETFIEAGEVMMENAGNAQVIGLSNLSRPFINRLIQKDFSRTMNISNRLDRPEFKLEARVMILRALLNPPKKSQINQK
jgi:hypothetical protein